MILEHLVTPERRRLSGSTKSMSKGLWKQPAEFPLANDGMISTPIRNTMGINGNILCVLKKQKTKNCEFLMIL